MAYTGRSSRIVSIAVMVLVFGLSVCTTFARNVGDLAYDIADRARQRFGDIFEVVTSTAAMFLKALLPPRLLYGRALPPLDLDTKHRTSPSPASFREMVTGFATGASPGGGGMRLMMGGASA